MLRKNIRRTSNLSRISFCSTPRSYGTTPDAVLLQPEHEIDIHQLSKNLLDLSPYPRNSIILNPQHFYQNRILMEWASKAPHPVSLRQLAGFGRMLTKEKIITSANFVRIELPIRLALRIRDLQTLPFGMVNNFHLTQVYESYYHAFNSFRKIPRINTLQDNDEFCQFLSTILDDHSFNLTHLMMGALEMNILNKLPSTQLDSFMSSMLRSRISRRVIVEEHLSLSDIFKSNPNEAKPPGYIGEMFHECSAVESMKQVAKLTEHSFKERYPGIKMPELIIDGDDGKFPFMVSHLHYLFGEILRNSYEATLNNFITNTPEAQLASTTPPPINITICDSKYDILLRVCDQGGGMSESNLQNIWSFGKSAEKSRKSLSNFHRLPDIQLYSNLSVTYSGSSKTILKTKEDILRKTSLGEIDANDKSAAKSSLSSLITRPYQFQLGLGLPMCKVYSDYWNGDLQMNSLHGYGCDTSLRLRKLGFHSQSTQLDRA